MRTTGNIDAVLDLKGHEVWRVSPKNTVYETIQLMADKNVGALLVMDEDRLLGLISERDYTRKVVLKGKTSKQVLVEEIMSTSVVTVSTENTVEEALRLMNDYRVRHLPVVQDGKVVGIVSIGNLVNWIISSQSATIDHLHDYISGKYPG